MFNAEMFDREWNAAVTTLAGVSLALIVGFAAGASFANGCEMLKEAP